MIRGKAQHHIAETAEVVVSLGIVLALLLVDVSVNFDDETVLRTYEIADVRTDWMLAADLLAIESMMPELSPTMLFGWGGMTTESA